MFDGMDRGLRSFVGFLAFFIVVFFEEFALAGSFLGSAGVAGFGILSVPSFTAVINRHELTCEVLD